jgi:ATP-dependent exoDNAse (exonuclease V) beta subunit
VSRLHLIRASAGTGKTERLSKVVLEALVPGSAAPSIALSGLVAVTYTVKAAGELRSRLRRTLARQGRYDEAQQLGVAYVGTVHAVCKRLLDEFSISAGLPPALDVLPTTLASRALSEAMEAALSATDQRRLDDVAACLRPNIDQFGGYSWLEHARGVLELARMNRVSPTQLPAMANRSCEAYLPLACPGRVVPDGAALDEQLKKTLKRTLAKLGEGDGTKGTNTTIRELQKCERRLARDVRLDWSEWKKLAEITATKASDDLLIDLRNVAASHRDHPRFRDDLRDYTTLIYRAAAEGLAHYAAWKEARGYLDYADMEARALDLLDNDEVKDTLAARLQLVVVDEFQDTSPIQLALFTKLAELAQRAVWVGDRKQSIYSFRGADPTLMDSVVATHERGGNLPETLGTSYRSRATLVRFASDLFVPGLVRDGCREDEVRVEAKRATDEPGLEKLPPLALWALEASNQKGETSALAEGLRRLLTQPGDTPVVDRATGEVRSLRASDIAVLTTTNDDAKGLADALGSCGIPAIVPRPGLLATPVGTMLHVGLRLVVDPGDQAARGIASALQGFDGQTPDVWLDGLIKAHRARRAARDAGEKVRYPESPLAGFAQLSPVECTDALIAHFKLPQLATRWPQPEMGRSNLEAFRALAGTYEEECRAERRGGSLVGFLRFLDDAAADKLDAQHTGGVDAIQIETYHGAKGLEWPVVILWSLDQKTRGFGLTPTGEAQRLEGGGGSGHFTPFVESDAKIFDPSQPLAGRWIRFNPWPYGATRTGDLMDAIAQAPAGRAQIAAASREALRLLYVGVTRARDHLVFAIKAKPPKKSSNSTEPTLETDWLDALHDGKRPLVELPTLPKAASATATIGVRGNPKAATPARVWRLQPGSDPPERLKVPTSRRWFKEGARAERPSFYIAPSRAETEWPEVVAGKWEVAVHDLGGRLPLSLTGALMDQVGTAVHAFFAADPMDAPIADRITVAQRVLAARGFLGLTRPEELVAAHDRLRTWVEKKMPVGLWRREVPVIGAVESATGRRQVRGAIDLLVQQGERSLVIDHKCFPGSREQAVERAQGYAGQMAAYARLASGVAWTAVHLPVVGVVVADMAMR